MKVICVTGSVGSGKTTAAKEIATKKGYLYIDVNKVVCSFSLIEGYDNERECKVVDAKRLSGAVRKLIWEIRKHAGGEGNMDASHIRHGRGKKALRVDLRSIIGASQLKKIKTLSKGMVIDSHMSHHLPKGIADACIVTKCGLKQLERRLKNRGYSDEKARENLDCEIFDVCRMEATENGHNVLVINTTNNINIEPMLCMIP